jgi:hypothetical protein
LANGKKNGALEAISRRPSPRKDFDANAEALIQLGLGRKTLAREGMTEDQKIRGCPAGQSEQQWAQTG